MSLDAAAFGALANISEKIQEAAPALSTETVSQLPGLVVDLSSGHSPRHYSAERRHERCSENSFDGTGSTGLQLPQSVRVDSLCGVASNDILV